MLLVLLWFTVFSVVIASGKRPVTFRTRKLRLIALMVLHSGGCGRVSHCRKYSSGGCEFILAPPPFFVYACVPHILFGVVVYTQLEVSVNYVTGNYGDVFFWGYCVGYYRIFLL